jgi:glucose/arabinose dehydrogenase
MKKNFVAAALVLIICGNTYVISQSNPVLPAGFSSQTVFSPDVAFTQPVGLTFNHDGSQMFVWEKRGRVYVSNYDGGTGKYVRQSTPVLNIEDEVGDWQDMGLVGFALDPNYQSNRMIYLLYVVDQGFLLNGVPDLSKNFQATIGRITKYQTTSNGNIVAIGSSRQVILGDQVDNGIPILYDSHGVGSLQFGSDGTLLASVGDGASYNGTDPGGPECGGCGSYAPQGLAMGIIRPNEDVGAYRSQMLNSFNGKILRMDTDGNGIPSNPFFDPSNPRSPKSLSFAIGLRNPFRFSVKPNTGAIFPTTGDPGTLYISEVGWEAREELNICDKPGQNFGWPLFQGMGRLFNYFPFGVPSKENKDEPNPLFGVNGCTVQFFRFSDLIRDEHPSGATAIFNPCNGSAQINPDGPGARFVHRRPKLDWFHADKVGNPSYPEQGARVPIFVGNLVDEKMLGDPGCPVAGPSFVGRAAIGNSFYSGDKYPPEYNNTFFFSDYGKWIRNISIILDNTLTEVRSFASINESSPDPNDRNLQTVGMAQNPQDGLIYYANFLFPATQSITGHIRKLVFGGNLPPIAKINITNNGGNNFGVSPLDIDFSSTGSGDPDGSIVSYAWDFGDGNTATGATSSNTFTFSGAKSFTVRLTVTDNGGASESAEIIISVNNSPPNVTIVSPPNNSFYPTGPTSNHNLTANVSDAEHPNSQLSYAWQTILRHNTHEHPGPPISVQSGSTIVGGEGCGGETFFYIIRLTVTDPLGLSTTKENRIYPDCAALPVTLLSFSANEKNRMVNLTWRTVNESLIENYVVERSSDGINFAKIGEVGPKDIINGSPFKNYDFLDNSPAAGKAYYRLKITHVDGSYEYSLIISISMKDLPTKGIKVYPTPFTTDLAVETYFYEPGEITIQLIDMQGRILKSRKQMVDHGTRSLTIGGLQNILPGTYYLNIILETGEIRKAKVMKMNNK